MTSALQNIKVVDLTRTLAGPFCTMMLGDMGADVIKIEEPERGDETRSWTPFWHGESTQFLSFNRNKRSLSLNLKAPEASTSCWRSPGCRRHHRELSGWRAGAPGPGV